MLKRDELNLPFGAPGSCCPRRRKEFPYRRRGSFAHCLLHLPVCLLRSQLLSRPGEGRGTATALLLASGVPGSASGSAGGVLGLRFRAPGLRIWKPGRLSLFKPRRAPSHLWLGTGPRVLRFTALNCWEFRPIPVRRNFGAWDCKVTPAGCACQGGNTTGCIPSNDGLGAGLRPGFPHCGKTGPIADCGEGTFWTSRAGKSRGSFAASRCRRSLLHHRGHRGHRGKQSRAAAILRLCHVGFSIVPPGPGV